MSEQQAQPPEAGETKFDMTVYISEGLLASHNCPNCGRLWTADNWPKWYTPADPSLKPFPPSCPFCRKTVLFKIVKTPVTNKRKSEMHFVSNPESRVWLAEQRARIAQLAVELPAVDDEIAFRLLIQVGSSINREGENWRCP